MQLKNKKHKKKATAKKIVTGNMIHFFIMILIVVLIVGTTKHFFMDIPSDNYNKANALIEQDKVVEAADILYSYYEYKDSASVLEKLSENNPSLFLYTLKTGDTFDFGTYQGEKINWTVLDKKNGKYLVESTYVLDAMCYAEGEYDHGYDYRFWENTIVNSWINGEFLNSFSEDQLKAVTDTKYGKAFILSRKEAKEYNEYCEAKGTSYCNSKLEVKKDGNSEYWLRYEKSDYEHVYHMSYEYSHSVGDYGDESYKVIYYWRVDDGYIGQGVELGVRPCMWIKPCEIK